jgi:hypothetical protein
MFWQFMVFFRSPALTGCIGRNYCRPVFRRPKAVGVVWTLRRPCRPWTCHGAYRMFEQVNASLGADWAPHDLHHSARVGLGCAFRRYTASA